MRASTRDWRILSRTGLRTGAGRCTAVEREEREMTHATDIVAYTFQGDTLCPTCVVRAMTPQGFNSASATPVEAMLSILADAAGIDRMDEHSFDSGDFPKVVFSSQVESAEPCGACGELID